MINKKDIRKQIKEEKLKLSLSEIEINSDIIINKLLARQEYNNSNIIFVYVSYNQEVITKKLIEQALEHKKVAVPKIANNQMDFYYIKSLNDLENGIMGILEPTNTSEANKAVPEDSDLFVVPGLGFDKNKNRIGYGKGYYDKYFHRHNKIKFHKIALAFDFQLLEQIPSDDFDVKLDRILTPTRVV